MTTTWKVDYKAEQTPRKETLMRERALWLGQWKRHGQIQEVEETVYEEDGAYERNGGRWGGQGPVAY